MVTDIGTGDKSAVVTDPTGGAPHGWSVQSVFNQFGYYPTQAEINALSPSFQGTYDVYQTGVSAVSQYVLQKQAEAERVRTDPLAALQTKVEDSVAQMKQQVEGLQGQLQDVLTSAPKLFGDLSPDQINGYLAPLKTAFDYQLGAVQGALGQRGLAGSSTEANALAQTGEQFKENVVSEGLNIGLTSQKNRADAIQQHINNLFGLTGQEEQIAGSAATTRSNQQLGQSNLIASLPFFLNQASQQQDLLKRQLNSGGGFFDTFNKVTGAINTGLDTATHLVSTVAPTLYSPYKPGGGAPGGPQRPADAAQFQTGSEILSA